MSKEKNLVFMNKRVPVVEGKGHRKLVHKEPELSMKPHCVSYLHFTSLDVKRYEGELDSYIVGPAIDRLYEFEKLGMEPEEIERKLKDYKVVMNRVYGLANEKEALTKGYTVTVEEYCTRINEKNEEIAELERRLKNAQHINNVCTNSITDMRHEIDTLTKANDELRSMNQKQYDNIAELQKEIEDLNRVLTDANETTDYWKTEARNAQKENRKLKHQCEVYMSRNSEQTRTVREYRERNEDLQEKVEKLEHIFSQNYIFSLEQEIKRLQSENNRLRKDVADWESACKSSDIKLSRSVETNKALQKQIEYYQDKLDRVINLVKEEE